MSSADCYQPTPEELEDWLNHPVVKRAARIIGWSPYQSSVTIIDLWEQVIHEMGQLEGLGLTCAKITEAAGSLPLPSDYETETTSLNEVLRLERLAASTTRAARELFLKNNQHLTANEAAGALGVDASTVFRLRKQAKLTKPPRSAGFPERMAYVRAHPNDRPTDIAKALGVSLSCASRLLTRVRNGE